MLEGGRALELLEGRESRKTTALAVWGRGSVEGWHYCRTGGERNSGKLGVEAAWRAAGGGRALKLLGELPDDRKAGKLLVSRKEGGNRAGGWHQDGGGGEQEKV